MVREESVLFGTYEEIKEWYNSLGIQKRDSVPPSELMEYKPFDEQIKEGKSDIKMICWLKQEINKDKIPPFIKLDLKSKLVHINLEKESQNG